ncbi:MAG TPA: hypothetical protein VIQ05_14955, partial [Tardiphaga sp.]
MGGREIPALDLQRGGIAVQPVGMGRDIRQRLEPLPQRLGIRNLMRDRIIRRETLQFVQRSCALFFGVALRSLGAPEAVDQVAHQRQRGIRRQSVEQLGVRGQAEAVRSRVQRLLRGAARL